MQTLKEWLASTELKELKALTPGELYNHAFFRDPIRPIYIDPTVFYAPADGVVLYAQEVQPGEPILNIKGKPYTLQDALDDPKYNHPSLVVGIFMTQYSVHVNRVPTSGYVVEQHKTPFLFTPNVSMVLEENELLENDIDAEDAEYLFANERCIVSVYCPKLRSKYYLVQIAEKDVSLICNFRDRTHYSQGDRYGMVRTGSQVDFILPLNKSHKFEIAVEKKSVVEAGVDPIIRVIDT